MKTCTKCGVEQLESEFYKSPRYRDGLETRCRTCKKSYIEDYLKRNSVCSHCKIRPHVATNALCYECARELSGKPAIPKFRRDSNNKTLCSRCKVNPRELKNNYCRSCNNKRTRDWFRSKGSSWQYLKSIGQEERGRAYAAVQGAIKNGKLIKPLWCEKCGLLKSLEGHHYKGYSKEFRLVVRWLCVNCHDTEHKNSV